MSDEQGRGLASRIRNLFRTLGHEPPDSDDPAVLLAALAEVQEQGLPPEVRSLMEELTARLHVISK